MNKAKAMFAAGMIVIVAGASAVCWYLNDKGIIGGENVSEQDGYVQQDGEYYADDDYDYGYDYDYNDSDSDGETTTEKQTEKDEENDGEDNKNENGTEKADYSEINEFLSTFSRLYFSENSSYSEKSPDSYELMKFAFLYENVFNNGKQITTKYTDDEIGAYNGIEASAAENIIDEFFGISVERNSIYTENTYAFFKYEDGCFYTPAADGIGYTNLAVAESVTKSGAVVSVEFTIYSDGVKTGMSASEARQTGTRYADGRAELRKSGSGYILTYYSVKK